MGRGAELANRLRRRGAQAWDQLTVRLAPRAHAPGTPPPWDGEPRFALLCVNYHTTRYLKLLLLTLAEQRERTRLLRDIVIVDQASRDGGAPFLRRLAAAVDRVALVERRHRLHHAVGMRAGLLALDHRDQGHDRSEAGAPANVLLFCDPDVLFLRDDVLVRLAEVFQGDPAISHAGELRTHLRPLPEAQASFLAVRRDWAARPGISPWVNHGSPAWWLQRDLLRAGGQAADFRGNEEGRILHRGRSAVQAARRYAPESAYATARQAESHFMGIEDGAARWAAEEARWADWLAPSAEARLIERLVEGLAGRQVGGVAEGPIERPVEGPVEGQISGRDQDG